MMVRLKGKKITVIGGGKVAERKIGTLLQSEGEVVVVSPVISEKIQFLAETKQLKWLKKEFEPADVLDSFLVIAATNRSEINQYVAQAVNEFQLLNIVDDPEKSNFIVPASFKQGGLTIAISTSGASPALAKKIKMELAEKYNDTYATYLDFLQICRSEVLQKIKNPMKKREILEGLLHEDFWELTKTNQIEERKKRFLSLLKDKEC